MFMRVTFFSYSFGCRVNEAEKIALDEKLFELGFIWNEKNPDFYIINSCSVTGKAEREVRQHIYQIRKKFPKATIIVTGCAATHWLRNNVSVSGVNHLIENKNKTEIPFIIQSFSPLSEYHIISHMRNNVVKKSMTEYPDQKSTVLDKSVLKHQFVKSDKFLNSGRLMVKIQDGCDRFCSYCIVPYLRGKPKSLKIKDIVQTINNYHLSSRAPKGRGDLYYKDCFVPQSGTRNDNGLSEVILTSINTACFGKDTGETLIQLIDAILKQTAIPKISFGSIHPWSITDEFLRYYRSIMPTNRFVPFFHIPIQSGSNTILKLMNRGYTKEEILKKLHRIKEINPKTFIGTDIIVGFPGETKKEFQETYEFLKSAPINKIHVFRFSLRPGTAAEKLIEVYGEPTPKEKRERSKLILELNKTISKRFSASLSK